MPAVSRPLVALRLAALAAASLAALPAAHAAGFSAPPVPPVGTRTVATADLLVNRPATTPCTVPLFGGVDFIGFSPVPYAFTPPAGCPGPWRRVVLSADFDVTAGRQFDRTAVIDLAGTNLYFGTTMEPGAATARAWHVERDVTEFSALFGAAQSGEAILYNVVNDTYTGHLHGSASLVFYPASPAAPAPRTATTVTALAPGLTALSPSNPTLSKTVTLARNTDRLVLSLVAQSQNNDEFWYTCVPDADADVLYSCPGTAFREVEVAVDGTPAGVAPVTPWIYTGGIDPALWAPTPGAQTLDFTPSQVDLTPFAGLMDDGQPHTVSVSVFNAQDNFSVTGTLLAFTDPTATVLSGAVTTNTLAAAPTVNVDDSRLVTHGAHTHGKVTVTSSRDFVIEGTLNTPRGPVTTTVSQKMQFRNAQTFDITDLVYDQDITQHTHVRETITTAGPDGTATRTTATHYPLTVGYHQTQSGNDLAIETTISQSLQTDTKSVDGHGHHRSRHYANTVAPHVVRTIDLTTNASTISDQHSSQRLVVNDTDVGCYDRTINVADSAVTSVVDGCTAAKR